MKSIFTRPLFINPQAYLTIPELSYIQMATPFDFTEDSYSFVINTSGRIEGKLLKTSNDYILHLDLYSIDGNCVLGEFYLNNSELNTDNFNLTQSKNIITLQFGEQSSGNITYPGLIAAWSAKGKTNDDEDRAILKDLTGNGHDITLNGFAFSEMSGYGGYRIKLNGKKYLDYNTYNFEVTETSIKIENFTGTLNLERISSQWTWNEYKIKVIGLNADEYLRIYYCLGSSSLGYDYIEIRNDGIYTVPQSTMSDSPHNRAPFIKGNFKNIAIELIPEYLDALVFDGVDDYGFSDNVPFLTDYTIIVKRNWIDTTTRDDAYICAKAGTHWNKNAFTFEGNGTPSQLPIKLISYGAISTNIKQVDGLISYMTPTSYNQIKITKGSNPIDDTNYFGLAKIRPETNTFSNFAFYSAHLFDRSLDEQEIKSFIRKYIDPEYLLPSEIPTPDCYYDFSKGSNDDENRDTIKDYSGNGNNVVAHNFAWSGMSGYGGYPLSFKDTKYNKWLSQYTDNTLSFAKNNQPWRFSVNIISGSLPSMKVNIEGIKDEDDIKYQYYDGIGSLFKTIKLQNGEILLPESKIGNSEEVSSNSLAGFTGTVVGDNTVTITLLPEYPGALVLDGVDDYISLDAFDSGFKTMFMVCKVHSNTQKILYDRRRVDDNNNFAIFHSSQSIAYSERNPNKTFINGKNNTSILCNQLVGKKILININTDYVQKGGAITRIGSSYGNGYFVNMSLYKFLGFKEALTEEQIQAVIKKYNLLDGVDEIEVS